MLPSDKGGLCFILFRNTGLFRYHCNSCVIQKLAILLLGPKNVATNKKAEEDNMVDPGAAISVKLGVELVKRVTPKGIAWISTWIKGKKLLVVGQPRAGKTSFVNYLQYGLFTDPNQKSRRTRHIRKTAAFSVDMGRDKALHLEVRRAIDTVGQALASGHADNFSKYKPDTLIVVLNLSSDWKGDDEYSAGFYLEEFFSSLASRLHNSKGLRKSTKSIFVVLNKKDLVKPQKISSWARSADKLIVSKLTGPIGEKAKDIPIMPCTLVEDKYPGKTPNAIIAKIALSLVNS